MNYSERDALATWVAVVSNALADVATHAKQAILEENDRLIQALADAEAHGGDTHGEPEQSLPRIAEPG